MYIPEFIAGVLTCIGIELIALLHCGVGRLSYGIGGKDEIAKTIYFVVHKKRVSVWI